MLCPKQIASNRGSWISLADISSLQNKTYLRSKATDIQQLQEVFVIDLWVKYTRVNNNKGIPLQVKCLINNFDRRIKSPPTTSRKLITDKWTVIILFARTDRQTNGQTLPSTLSHCFAKVMRSIKISFQNYGSQGENIFCPTKVKMIERNGRSIAKKLTDDKHNSLNRSV